MPSLKYVIVSANCTQPDVALTALNNTVVQSPLKGQDGSKDQQWFFYDLFDPKSYWGTAIISGNDDGLAIGFEGDGDDLSLQKLTAGAKFCWTLQPVEGSKEGLWYIWNNAHSDVFDQPDDSCDVVAIRAHSWQKGKRHQQWIIRQVSQSQVNPGEG